MAKLNLIDVGNVSLLGRKGKEKFIFASFTTFLKRKGQDSENTKKTYERAIRDFFLTMRGTKVEYLTEEDLIFSKQEIENYSIELREHFKTKTVNGAMSALREFYKRLKDDGFSVDLSWFDVDRYKENDSEKYDSLSHEEVLNIMEFLNTRLNDTKRAHKVLLVRLAYATAYRKQSLLELTWDDIVDLDGVKFIKTIGKGNKESYKKISDSLYHDLMNHKKEFGTEKIIDLNAKTVQRMMDSINKNLDFGERNIVFHSFKKASIKEVGLLTGGDIKAMQAHGDHNSAQTMLDFYLDEKKKEDLVVVDTEDNFDLDAFKNMSHEELLNLVESMDRNTKVKMLLEFNKK